MTDRSWSSRADALPAAIACKSASAPSRGAPAPRRSPTGAARARPADCSEEPPSPRDGRGCPADWRPDSRIAIGADASASTPTIVARFALRVDHRQRPHGVHPRLIGKVARARSLSSGPPACRGTESRGRRRSPARRRSAASSSGAGRPAVLASRRDRFVERHPAFLGSLLDRPQELEPLGRRPLLGDRQRDQLAHRPGAP